MKPTHYLSNASLTKTILTISALVLMGAEISGATPPRMVSACSDRVNSAVMREDVVTNIDGTCSVIDPLFMIHGKKTRLAINGDLHVMCELAGFGPRSGVDVRSGETSAEVEVAFLGRGDSNLYISLEKSKIYTSALTCR